jgi:hypothetical protein
MVAAGGDHATVDLGAVDLGAVGPPLDRLRERGRGATTAAPRGLAFRGLAINPKAD